MKIVACGITVGKKKKTSLGKVQVVSLLEDASLNDQTHAAGSSGSRVMSAMNVHEPAFLLG